MRIQNLALLAALVAIAAGCKKEEPAAPAKAETAPTTQEAAEGADPAKTVTDKAVKSIKGAENLVEAAKNVQALGKDGPELTIEQYEKLLVGLSACSVDDRGIDRKCAAWTAYNEARRNRRNLIKTAGGGLSALGRKHIAHDNPAVRLQASTLMGSLFGASKDSQAAIIEAARKEQVPGVLKAMIRTVSSSIGKNEDILKLVMDNAAHENEKVRKEVVSALTSSWARTTTGTLEKAMEMVEKDASPEVRRYGCSRLGARGDERALPLLEKMTTDAKKDPRLYADCMRGLIGMWSSPIVHETPSEKAYKLTMKRLKETPRDEHKPAWASLSSMMWAKNQKFQARATWFKQADLVAALSDIVKDRSAYWMARTGAVDTLKELGAEKSVFEDLKKAYADAEGKPGQDKHVHDKIAKVLAGNK